MLTEQTYQKAILAHQQNDFATAEQLYLQLLEEDPQEAQVHYLLGVLYLSQRRYPEALVFINQALEKDANHVPALCCKACLSERLYDFQRAAEVARQALACEPKNLEARIRLGVALRRAGELEEAEQALRTALTLREDMALIHAELGWVFLIMEKEHWARSAFHSALQHDELCLSALRGLGEIALKRGDIDRAHRQFGRLLAAHQDQPESHADMGRLFLRLGRLEWARGAFQTAIRLDKAYREAWTALAALYIRMGWHRRAYNAARSAWYIRPQDPEITAFYARTALGIGEVHVAIGLLRGLESLWPTHPELPVLHGFVCYAKGDRELAEESLRQTVLRRLSAQVGMEPEALS